MTLVFLNISLMCQTSMVVSRSSKCEAVFHNLFIKLLEDCVYHKRYVYFSLCLIDVKVNIFGGLASMSVSVYFT